MKSEMDVNIKKKTSSQDLMSCGDGGGIRDTLLLKPRSPLQTEKIPRSSVLDRLQSFLPQMAAANEKLLEQMEDSPAGRFDIECVEEADRVIQMDVALVDLSGSEEEEEEEEETTSDEEDSEEEREVTEENLKLPSDGNRKRKANIQVLEEQQ